MKWKKKKENYKKNQVTKINSIVSKLKQNENKTKMNKIKKWKKIKTNVTKKINKK